MSILNLYYKDNVIAYRQIIIENYEAQNYTYEIIYDKNYAEAGTKFEFDVKVNHITGIAVPNKTVRASMDSKTYRVTTDENGIAHFSVEIPASSKLYSDPETEVLTIYNGDSAEYTGKEIYMAIYSLNKDVHTTIEKVNDTYEATLHKLLKDKDIKVDYNLVNLHGDVYNTNVIIK